MTLQSSGGISVADVAREFRLANRMGSFYGAAPGVPTAGFITLGHFYGKSAVPRGQAMWEIWAGFGDAYGILLWTVPAGVKSICVVTIGMGADGGGGGGALAWKNNIAVTPGEVFQIRRAGRSAYFNRHSTGATLLYALCGDTIANGGKGGTFPWFADGGGNGGDAGIVAETMNYFPPGGGGAGGYLGKGGNGGLPNVAAQAGTGGGGGGGGARGYTYAQGGAGGGVGPYGIGDNGAAGVYDWIYPTGGGGGSGGDAGQGAVTNYPRAGKYGGGGSCPIGYGVSWELSGTGCIRIIWGEGRSFPYNAGDV